MSTIRADDACVAEGRCQKERGTSHASLRKSAAELPLHYLSVVESMENTSFRSTFAWSIFRRKLPSTALRSVEEAAEATTSACRAPIDMMGPRLRSWRKAVRAAAVAHAAASGADRNVAEALQITLTAGQLRRSGGSCPPVLAPHLTSAGFIRGLVLLSGSAQRIRWRPPHHSTLPHQDILVQEAGPMAGVGDVYTELREGYVVFHHSAMRCSATAANASMRLHGARWLSFLVWFHLEPTAKGTKRKAGASRASAGGSLVPLWHSPVLVANSAADMQPDMELVATLVRRWRGSGVAEPAERDGGCRADQRTLKYDLRCRVRGLHPTPPHPPYPTQPSPTTKPHTSLPIPSARDDDSRRAHRHLPADHRSSRGFASHALRDTGQYVGGRDPAGWPGSRLGCIPFGLLQQRRWVCRCELTRRRVSSSSGRRTASHSPPGIHCRKRTHPPARLQHASSTPPARLQHASSTPSGRHRIASSPPAHL